MSKIDVSNIGGYFDQMVLPSKPWASSSVSYAANEALEIDFGSVSRYVRISNTDQSDTIYVGFTENGMKAANSNYVTLNPYDPPFEANIAVTKIYVTTSNSGSSYYVYAELPGIVSSEAPVLSASNGDQGVG